MVDLHTHLLPAVDDGAKDVQESLDMLAESYRQGVRLCAATPHCVVHSQQHLERFLERREASFRALARALPATGCPEVILGAEVFMDNDLSAYQGIQRLCLGDTRYMLVEFPVAARNPRLSEWLYTLTLQDIVPVVAHLDRYPDWESLAAEFSGLNLRCQINASRLLSLSGRRLFKRLVRQMGDVIIASDMHNTTTRPCDMRRAWGWAQRKYPEDADRWFRANAEALLREKP